VAFFAVWSDQFSMNQWPLPPWMLAMPTDPYGVTCFPS